MYNEYSSSMPHVGVCIGLGSSMVLLMLPVRVHQWKAQDTLPWDKKHEQTVRIFLRYASDFTKEIK